MLKLNDYDLVARAAEGKGKASRRMAELFALALARTGDGDRATVLSVAAYLDELADKPEPQDPAQYDPGSMGGR